MIVHLDNSNKERHGSFKPTYIKDFEKLQVKKGLLGRKVIKITASSQSELNNCITTLEKWMMDQGHRIHIANDPDDQLTSYVMLQRKSK